MFHLRLFSKISGNTTIKRVFSITPLPYKVAAFREQNCMIIEKVGTKNGARLKFPLVWLRDNCQCDQCFHRESSSRVLDWSRFNVNVEPVDIAFNDNTSELEIRWNDDHCSIHSMAWLKKREFSEEARETHLRTEYRPVQQLWRKDEFSRACKSFDYNNLLQTDSGLHNWLHALSVHGVALIEATPDAEDSCRRLADRVGFIRRTHYGEEFIVRNKEGTSNVAYLSTPLQMHTDLPYYEYTPGVNLLHCLVQTKSPGAFNLLTDGLWLVDQLRTRYPKEYHILTTTMVDWIDVGSEDGNRFHSLYRAPVICLDREGNFQRINHSTPQRDSQFSIPLEHVEPWYKASAVFVELLHQGAVQFKTKPGDILTFDNTRLIHGRTGYTDYEGNTRHLVGAYLDWDEIYSRLRVLKRPQ